DVVEPPPPELAALSLDFRTNTKTSTAISPSPPITHHLYFPVIRPPFLPGGDSGGVSSAMVSSCHGIDELRSGNPAGTARVRRLAARSLLPEVLVIQRRRSPLMEPGNIAACLPGYPWHDCKQPPGAEVRNSPPGSYAVAQTIC